MCNDVHLTVMIGRTIGKYRIVGQLGRGGAGIVYRAVDETLNRDVAIKTLNPELADTEIMKRFRAEATILAKLNHPQIATIYELFRSETDLLMVMEFVRGEALDKLSERLGPMPPAHATYLVDQVLSALEHSHRAGIVHRDMKPANVMVTTEGGVKIMDFGIARVRGAEQMTVDGRLMGTPAYMPPEQVLGQEVDGRADLYSVGVLFYRLLTGALPFMADTPVAMLQRHILETPMPLEAHRADLPEWCETIVKRALAKSPGDRFQTAEEFREALGGASSVMMPADLATVFAIPDGDVMTAPAQSASAHTLVLPAKSALSWAYSTLAVLAVSGTLVAYFALKPREAEPMTAAAASHRPATESTKSGLAARRPASESTRAANTSRRSAKTMKAAAPILFETKALVGTKGKQREREAHLTLADGNIIVTADDATGRTLYEMPYESVISISYSRGRDPLWNSPQGPTPVTRVGGTLGRMGFSINREWISLRTNTKDQFVSMRFDHVLIRRVLLELEERTGRTPQLVVARKEPK